MFFGTYPNNRAPRRQTVLQRALLLSLILGAAVVISSGSGTADDPRQMTQAATPAAPVPPNRTDADAPLSAAMSGSSAPAMSDGPVEALPQSPSQESAAADRHRRALLVLILRSTGWHVSPFPK